MRALLVFFTHYPRAHDVHHVCEREHVPATRSVGAAPMRQAKREEVNEGAEVCRLLVRRKRRVKRKHVAPKFR